MKDNLITISKDAAKTIGLNEAVLLEILKSIPNNPNNFDHKVEEIKELAPFWDSDQIEELLGSLKAKGLLERKGQNRSPSTDRSKKIKYSPELETSKSFKNKIDTFLENDWMPNNSTFKQAAEYGIPEDFALSYLDDFSINIDLVLKQLTKGNHKTDSKGESPSHVSECRGSKELSSFGN